MKNKEFFYLQYDKINWENQKITKLNSFVDDYIIKNIILKHNGDNISLFDIGFGIGFFFKMLDNQLPIFYEKILLSGCEPSKKNYKSFIGYFSKREGRVKLKTYNKTFQEINGNQKFDFITSIYVFPHFELADLVKASKKISSMLTRNGKFILVVANETYIKEKLRTKKDLFIEKNIIKFDGKSYEEILHYSDIPSIGKVIDYNREESFYPALFKKVGLRLNKKINFNDSGFKGTIFVFGKY